MADVGLVMLTTAVVVGTTEYKNIRSGTGFTMKPVIAGFVVGTVLLVISAGAPELGTWFCWLVMVGAILRNGSGLLTGAYNAVTAKKA